MSTLRERNAERLRNSIAGAPIDSHAVFNFYTYPFFHKHSNVPLNEYFHNPAVMLEAQLEVLDKIDNCGNLMPDVGAVAECSGLGGKVRFDSHGFISVHEVEIEEYEDVIKIKPADPYGDNYMRIALEQLEYMVQHCPKGMKVNAHPIMGPFTVAAQLRGISDFCADTIAEPEMVDALLDVVIQTQIAFLHAQEKILGAPLHHVLVCDDLSAFLNPQMYEELIIPTYEKLFAEFPNTQRWLHNDSTTRHIVSQIPKGGFSAWQYGPVLQPLEAAEGCGNQVTVMGGLNPVELAGYTVEQTIDVCNQVIDSFQGNPRCVLSAAGSINQVPLENIRAMMRVADERKISK